MKLSSAREGQVVRNVDNGSHYRYERPEKGRVRIWPLELFPNGLLIAKPTPTIVDPNLDVVFVAMWTDGMRVEGKSSHSRRTYEAELAKREIDLVGLLAEYEKLPVSGIGKQSRGSWSNKIKNCQARIETLRLGLAEPTTDALAVTTQDEAPRYRKDDLVHLPSGLPGRVQSVRGTTALVRTRYEQQFLQMPVPFEVLAPWDLARVATV